MRFVAGSCAGSYLGSEPRVSLNRSQDRDSMGNVMRSKLLLAVVCALAIAGVVYSIVDLSIDMASLSAEMPIR